MVKNSKFFNIEIQRIVNALYIEFTFKIGLRDFVITYNKLGSNYIICFKLIK